MKTAVVLSGGGTKGSYQIGVWKALRRLHIKYDIVTGTSIGALNGAFMVQKDYYKAVKLWTNIDYDLVIDNKLNNTDDRIEVLKEYTKGVIDGGLSVSALEKTITEHLNVKKFFKSSIDYALVTARFPTLTPVIKTKKDLFLESDLVKDYLMASSACFPAFKTKKIDDIEYIDGGYYDNLPINVAIDLGAKRIIAVDLDAVGIKRKPKENVDITYITPRNDYGSFLTFDKNLSKRGIRLGYNDTLKIFNKLDGDKYTFKRNQLKKCYNRYGKKYYQLVNTIIDIEDTKNPLFVKFFEFALHKRLTNKDKEKAFYECMEKVGEYFLVDDSYIYRYRKFNRLLKKSFNKIKPSIYDRVDEDIRFNKLKLLFSSIDLIYYLYKKLDTNDLNHIKKLALIFPKELLCAIYLKVIL